MAGKDRQKREWVYNKGEMQLISPFSSQGGKADLAVLEESLMPRIA
ncbi:hypothetical protein [Anoxynatronum sibiricum]